MHKERTSNIGISEKFVFDKEDIDFISCEGSLLTQGELAKHFGVSVGTISEALKRQPEMRKAYDISREKNLKMYKEQVTPKELGGVERIVFDENDIKKIEELAPYLTTEQIAKFLRIGKTTFYEILKRQEEVNERYQAAIANKYLKYALQLEKKAFGTCSKGELSAIVFFLKTRAGWSEAVPETKTEDEIVLTPEQQEEKDKQVKLFTQFKKEKGFE